jgi:hypothetical protein
MRPNTNTNRQPSIARFALGQTYVTLGAEEALMIARQTGIELLRRHMSNDWGDLSDKDVRENELSLKEGFRLLSAYRTAKGQKLGSSPKPTAAPRRFCYRANTDPATKERAARMP